MLIRIVKMNFKTEEIDNFLELFSRYKNDIRKSTGCCGLELYQDIDELNMFFTYSFWESQQDLEHYRQSEIFKMVWPKTKAMFKDKAHAWSVNKIVSLP
ncbi:MAG: antibiotic biosynthesis monooxygenase [Bacteroidia bacterium]|nr:antibiotic biosynthesis monooxygenase [Bacteroidia bacterium]NNF81909.1 antibiotic biosynthesis monooxygenase [Flavobacteriaceae bacterium]NNL81612.1 antibiotic biosynthesis monooxygenase [Flavobacteriaceae bacterium]